MKKTILWILPVLIAIFSVTTMPRAASDRSQDVNHPYVQVELVYNTEVYQRPFFLLPKSHPTFSIWVEESVSGYRESIFVTEKAAKNKWHFTDSRPEAIPVWYGIQKQEKQSRSFDIDAVSGATPKGEAATIYWAVPQLLRSKSVELYIEANNSFDFNAHYHKKKGTPGYSGANGQPSVIWKASLDFSKTTFENLAPKIIGHGNLFGETHQIVHDLSKITTAAETFQTIRISYITP